MSSFENDNDLQCDSFEETYVLYDIQNQTQEIKENLNLSQFDYPLIRSNFSFDTIHGYLKPKELRKFENLDSWSD